MASKSLVDDSFYDVIFDRFHLGAAVYGEKYRGANPADIYELDYKYLHHYADAALILLTDDPKAIAARDDGDSLEKSLQEYNETMSAFIEAYTVSACMHKLHINISSNGGFVNTIPTVTKFLDGVRL
jgi:thymidylate kinase